jgi:histidinol-phosphatase (PHP family)
MIDYHIHTDLSGDCEVPMEKMAEAARRRGLAEICFTDHIDLDFPGDIDFIFDFREYDRKYAEVKSAYPDINIKKGLEAGLELRTAESMAAIAAEHGFDYVIGSRHLVMGFDPFGSELWRLYSQKEAYEAYLQECIECVSACDFYDVFGHLGFVSKFCPFEDALMRYGDYKEMLDVLLRMLIEKGKGLEVNTGGIKNTGSVMPEASIIKRYFELGGEITTVGSDAHEEYAVGRAVGDTLGMLKSIGFKYVCAFDKRRPRFLTIP